MFELIKNITLNNQTSWKDNIFITIDIDWVIDEVLLETINLLKKYKAKATLFTTHSSPLIKVLENDDDFELGIHPNFNYLLNGDFRYGSNIKEVVDYFKDFAPTAVSIRSHSLTTNSIILDYISKAGFTHECNLYIPTIQNTIIYPFRHLETSLIRIPHFWEDDVFLIDGNDFDLSTILKYRGIKVFNFHPIHIFLNSESTSRYNTIKTHYTDFSYLKKNVNNNIFGINTLFKKILMHNY